MSAAVNRPVWNSAPATTSPMKSSAADEGTTKNAMRRDPASSRVRSRPPPPRPAPAARDISGSSAAEIAMPKRLTGMR